MIEILFTFLNGLGRGLLLFTMAAGLSLVFGLMSVLNLAHGSLLLLGGYIAVMLASGAGLAAALPVALIAGAAFGAVLYFAVKPVMNRGHLDQGLLTLGIAFIFADVAKHFWGNDVYLPAPPEILRGSVGVLGMQYPVYRLFVIVAAAAIALVIFVVVERTRLGAIVRAAVADKQMVAALGYRISFIMGGVFAGAAALAAIGGVIGAPVIGVRPGLDTEMLILALVVVVVGGLGSLRGALVGALLIGQIQTLGVALLPELSSFLVFGVMALVLLVKPTGLFGKVNR
ncbi:branched-chain amino acid transport system permease protein [Cryobacterium flavum]|uniref:Branched-chain amino acid ABC transporter permease n=1 Tax=Cryobacterium flavum TaxID=1424659 RepID=A0A4V3I965_9MICO|nr:branched-chain amino acid ABC transporter permease [Cryobacterium flavum]TFB77976.1 branched-chain amino acid ABC transporter permease [Cryobacterium flavum]SDO24078.1 branched-chain amino acid transport system permease protein [Cryobacterium flavum]